MTDRPRVDIVNFNFFDWDGERVFAGGAERYVLELARLIDALGAQPRIVQNAHRHFSRVYREVPVVGVPATDSMDLVRMSAGFADWVGDAALVIASPVELATHLRTVAPVIGINHGIHWDYPNNRLEVHDAGIERRVIEAVRACRICVGVDTNFGNWLRCLDAEAASRVRYVPNFVDLDVFRPPVKRFDGPLTVLFPRRLCEERGFRNLVAAFDRLLPRHPSLTLEICGAGPADDEAIAQAFVAQHPGRVLWSRPDLDEMPSVFGRSHIVLIPTVFAEGTSLACLEAMATHNAVIATAVGGLPNLVIDGFNALIAGGRVEDLVDAVERLAADRALLARLAQNGLTLAPAFARDRWAARWNDVLSESLPVAMTPRTDPYAPIAWPFGLEAEQQRLLVERDAARDEAATNARAASETRSAQLFAEQQLAWRDAELAGIKNSTGWALLQWMYKVRFALFPHGSLRERAGKWLMHRGRAMAAARRRNAPPRLAEPEPPAVAPQPLNPHGFAEPAHYAVVCLPILEWNFRLQRPQQLARCFARQGHEVLFAKHSFGDALSARPVEPNIEEIELPGTPGTNPYRDALSDADAQRMADALVAHLAARGTGRFVCIVQLPFWAKVARRLREIAGCDVVYDCMDLHAGFSSNTDAALADEEALLSDADLVVCASQSLLEHAAPHASRAVLVRNGVDYEHFARVAARGHGTAVTIGYYGAIADWFDSDLVAGIARLRPQWRVVLIGSTWSADTAPLTAASNVTLTGEKPYLELPALIAEWDCCIIPFRHTPLTQATNPVKVYEMLAAAKPVVSVGLPELVPMSEAGLVALAEGPEAFVEAIEAQLVADDADAQAARRAFAAANTWEMRANAIDAAIGSLAPQVSVIVVTFNNRDLNELCLTSLFNDTDYPDFEVVVVDNASIDGTPDLLREFAAREPRLRIVLNADNRGFAAANNQGAAIARGRYLCFLNNDTVVHGAWLRTLVSHLRRHARLGLVGPVTNAIGNEAQIPVGYQDLAGMPAWADAHCEAHRGPPVDIAMLAFFCVALPRWVWHIVGPMDERFGTGMFEDDDYNRRVRTAGFDVGLARDAFVHHWQKASFRLLGEDEYLRIYRENKSRYAAKWAAPDADGDPLAELARAAERARGTVIFAPSVGWAIQLAQRPHHLARVLAADGYVVVFDSSNAHDDVDKLREIEPRLFLYRGPPAALAGLPRTTLWTFTYNYDYRDAFPKDTAVVYDWIDDLSVFPYDQRRLATLHARALREADVVLSVARKLHEEALRERPDARYAPNAVEAGRFEREPEPNPALADPEFAKVIAAGRPIAGYYGALASWFDYALVAEVARLRPDWSFALIGPDYDGSLARFDLDHLPNVYCLGPRPYAALPGYLHRFTVAMIPFQINEITLATSPLKLYEYFAAGRPVISTPLPECAAFDEVRIVRNAGELSAALDAAPADATKPEFISRLATLAAHNTWEARARDAMQAIDEVRAKTAAAPLSPDAHALMQRFAALENPGNRRFFRALAVHLASIRDDPCLPMYFEFALSANDRGRRAATLIESIVPLAGKRALDVGCAYGGFVVALEERGALPTGFDIDPQLLALAEHNFRDVGRRLPIHRADVTRPEDVAPFREMFDVICCNDVIEHVRDPAIAIRHIASMLRPGGLAYFEIPNRDAVGAVLADGHYQLFGITQLDREAAGRYYAGHAPGVPYGVEHYLRLPEYQRLFEAAGMVMALVPDAAAAQPQATVREALAALREALPSKLDSVPSALREEVREAVLRYLDEAERPPATAFQEHAWLERYGVGFWKIIARKPGGDAQGKVHAPARQLDYVGPG